MPTAMVIPAPSAYIKVVAGIKLVGLLYERPFTYEGKYLVVESIYRNNMQRPSHFKVK